MDKEYIEREEAVRTAISAIVDILDVHTSTPLIKIACRMREQPTADVVEVKHGEWIWEETMSLVDPAPIILCCSVCYGCHDVSEDFKYCPHCGAKMDGTNERP